MIRVIRVIEYTYDNVDKMRLDMSRWSMDLVTKSMTMRTVSKSQVGPTLTMGPYQPPQVGDDQ